MSVTIGTCQFSMLTAQPFGYEGEARSGHTARQWLISGLLTQAQWTALLAEYDAWRTKRIQDADTATSGVIGTTIDLTATSNGITWSAIKCWFTQAPESTQVGTYIQASVTLVDAQQALEVVLAEATKAQNTLTADLGTITIGTAVLKLLAPADTYQDVPQLQLTASGVHAITGALTATRVRAVQGETDAAGWQSVRSWFETTVASRPAAGSWFPITAPKASAEARLVSGVKQTIYQVTLDLAEVK